MPLRRAALALLLLVAPLFARDAATQTRPRTPWGDPDLQGVWPGGPVFAVPFERDPEFGTRATLSAEEAATRNAEVDAQSSFVTGNFFPELGHAPALTSLISDPENGRLPPMTDDGPPRGRVARHRRPGVRRVRSRGTPSVRPMYHSRCLGLCVS